MVQTEELRILLRTVADTTGAQQTQQSLRGTQLAIGAAAGVAAKATELLTDRVADLIQFYGTATQTARDHERVIRATSMAYGEAAGQYQQFAQQLSTTTGFTSDAILEAALSARTLSQNYGLSIQQTQKLITVSADLARVRGIGISEAFERVQSAIRGEAEASEYLGLTLNDTYLTNQAMNGSLKNTFGTMTDLQKAQVRYNELLRQSAQFSGLAAASTNSLDAAFNKAGTSAHTFELALGNLLKGPTLVGLGALAAVADDLSKVLGNVAKTGEDVNAQRFGGFLQNLGGVLDQLRQHPEQSLVDIVRNVQAAGDAANANAQQQDQARQQAIRDERERQRLIALNANTPPVANAAQLRQLAIQDQLQAATRDLIGLQTQSNTLQQQATQLSAEEARVKLSLLPAQQQMAAAQRDMTEQQLRARQAALPATEALEDLRYEQQRAQLVASNRQASSADRIAARRELRTLARAAPGVELASLDADRGLVPGARAATRLGIQAQLIDIAGQRALAGVTAAQQVNQLQQAITGAMIDAQRQVLQELAGQLTQGMTLTVNITHEDGRVDTYTELIEANTQAQLPPVVPQSGVRRGN